MEGRDTERKKKRRTLLLFLQAIIQEQQWTVPFFFPCPQSFFICPEMSSLDGCCIHSVHCTNLTVNFANAEEGIGLHEWFPFCHLFQGFMTSHHCTITTTTTTLLQSNLQIHHLPLDHHHPAAWMKVIIDLTLLFQHEFYKHFATLTYLPFQKKK